jgi:UDP-2-acetamido-2,6-beta-L-arabino-hexul-4-ose reductase
MRVLITGADGFIGRNLAVQLAASGAADIVGLDRESGIDTLRQAIDGSDFVCHLAGVNRPDDAEEFERINTGLTRVVCEEVRRTGRRIPVLLTSSTHADRPTPYGRSKLAAEQMLLEHHERHDLPVFIFRLANVFGKWCRPNYNSVVATFCHNIANDLPVRVDDASAPLTLVYIDDVVASFIRLIQGAGGGPYCETGPTYHLTVGELWQQISAFRHSRTSLVSERVGTGLRRALHATYLSYLPPAEFAYAVPCHNDQRGTFVEMLKTQDSGQVSFFTALPGVTRGGHYHHSKTEKFLVAKGTARFRFRHLVSGEYYEVCTSGEDPRIVETVPGWTHDITNIGEDEMVVVLWANEQFDRDRPDTYLKPV